MNAYDGLDKSVDRVRNNYEQPRGPYRGKAYPRYDCEWESARNQSELIHGFPIALTYERELY